MDGAYELGFSDGYGEGLADNSERVFRSRFDAESYAHGLADGKALKRAEEVESSSHEADGYLPGEAEEIMHGYLYGHYSEEHIRRYGGPS